jgi:hypothetical protein
MTEETHSKSKHIVSLAKELLDDIELSRSSAESLLLKAMRLARLVDAEKPKQWLAYELGGYPVHDEVAYVYMGSMGRWIDYDKKIGYWIPLAQIEASTETVKLQLQMLRVPDVSYSPGDAHQAFRADSLTLSAPVNAVIKKSEELYRIASQCHGIRSRVLAHVHAFVVGVYHEKLFSTLAENIFEQYKSRIDALLAEQAGATLEKIPSIYNRLAEGDPEAISHAQASCRRMIDAFADAIYPPTDEAVVVVGKPVILNKTNVRERINQYVRSRTDSQSRRDKLRQTLANLYNRVSTGVHNDVSPEEAQSLFLQMYMFLGEVLTLGDPPGRPPVSLDTVPPSTTNDA